MPLVSLYQKLLNMSRYFEGLAPLALRIYLAPVLIQAGYNKLAHFEDTVAWFANPDWGLGLPMPALMAGLAAGTEFFGAILLLLGLATRLISIPLMITMLVAALTVHWPNGWLAIADGSSWLANDRVLEAGDKLIKAKELLQEHGNYDWLTSSGNFAVLNNGIEFAITYFIMLLALFTLGGGRYTSLDYFIAKRCGIK
ncbi:MULTISPECIES: HvfX family Cu-binding RiPP maturation protein [unclassified Shewanella]|uniref:HvfX family Cu-binding RiPP maturation protein n=1 Tax=Shewanella TaxID=22 RepID=UPI0021D8276D|nr:MULTISPECIES: DoxX family protein [unclassified Shewanella]MCU7973965.1 DoxX family protein [Shewanella sp. SW36]MCU7989575.1 DoxX family protein [Shewanella sp. SW1]MCU8017492.1 DoxX family protein [Shewanella sp. SM72]MCU8050347.1 DoxX family protein [Shewanella sp. SM43]MCU8105997.1 DoxX family protein [Shewanella sp. SM101]